jgi:hypothetical protein
MLLNIDKVKPTAKSLVVTAGGKEYFAKKESGLAVGMSIDAETKDSEYNGKNYCWIEKFKPIQSQQHAAAAASSGGGTALGMAWLPMASNVVAHAISAGIITTPNQVKPWLDAVKLAITGQAVNGDDIPY